VRFHKTPSAVSYEKGPYAGQKPDVSEGARIVLTPGVLKESGKCPSLRDVCIIQPATKGKLLVGTHMTLSEEVPFSTSAGNWGDQEGFRLQERQKRSYYKNS